MKVKLRQCVVAADLTKVEKMATTNNMDELALDRVGNKTYNGARMCHDRTGEHQIWRNTAVSRESIPKPDGRELKRDQEWQRRKDEERVERETTRRNSS